MHDEETFAEDRTSPHVVFLSLSVCVSVCLPSTPSEALSTEASLTFKSGFLSFFSFGAEINFESQLRGQLFSFELIMYFSNFTVVLKLIPKDECTSTFRNVGKYSPKDTASHPTASA